MATVGVDNCAEVSTPRLESVELHAPSVSATKTVAKARNPIVVCFCVIFDPIPDMTIPAQVLVMQVYRMVRSNQGRVVFLSGAVNIFYG